MSYRFAKDEWICVRFPNALGEDAFLITNKQLSGMYYLYEVKDGALTKLGKSDNPLVLEDKFDVMGKVAEINKSI